MSNPRDISHFISNLNSLEPLDSSYNEQGKDEELSIFSNTNFFDFDVGRSTNIATTVDDLLMQQERNLQDPKTKLAIGEFIGQHYPEAESSRSGAAAGRNHRSYHTPSAPSPSTAAAATTVSLNDVDAEAPWGYQTLQQFSLASDLSLVNETAARLPLDPVISVANPAEVVVNAPHTSHTSQTTQASHTAHTSSSGTSSYAHSSNQSEATNDSSHTTPTHESNNNFNHTRSNSASASSRKRKAEAAAPMDPHVAAEEDKRRRNTEASARFRIKKKIKEQEMERQIRKLEEHGQEQENRIMELEMENKWLKNLVMEKTEARSLNQLSNMKKQLLGEEVKAEP